MMISNKTAACKIATAFILPLVLIAFAVKSLFPSGFMPVVNKDGYTRIVICSGAGEKTITVPADQAPSEQHKNGEAPKICSFMALASAVSLPALPALTLPVAGVFVSAFSTLPETALNTYRDIPYPPRGPPAVYQI